MSFPNRNMSALLTLACLSRRAIHDDVLYPYGCDKHTHTYCCPARTVYGPYNECNGIVLKETPSASPGSDVDLVRSVEPVLTRSRREKNTLGEFVDSRIRSDCAATRKRRHRPPTAEMIRKPFLPPFSPPLTARRPISCRCRTSKRSVIGQVHSSHTSPTGIDRTKIQESGQVRIVERLDRGTQD